ncbi:MAG: metal-dependent hydrolase [Nitrospira sp. CR1.3]|nr:metal-dependent hydrolase [Nitrospira sp. CR1.3]
MASPLTHAVVAATIAVGFRIPSPTLRYWLLGVMCAEVADLDVIGFWIGVPYDAVLGHRGVTHSILFAILFSLMITRWTVRWGEMNYQRLWGFFFLATFSHAILDALTDGGLGVAFFAPFDNTRYFFPHHPIAVTPLEPAHALGPAAVTVLFSEATWVWIPCVLYLGGRKLMRGRATKRDG